jgi:hypothetical protein
VIQEGRTPRRIVRALLLAVFALGAQGTGTRVGAQAPISPSVFSEHSTDTVRVASPGVRVGLMAAEPDAPLDARTFALFVPGPSTRTLCARITSQDGRYGARLEVRPTYPLQGRVRISLPTRMTPLLSGYRTREVAILAWVADDCTTREDYFVVATWNAAAPTGLVLLLNARESTRVVLPVPGDSLPEVIGCPELDDARTVAFNRACLIPAPPAAARMAISVQRATFVRLADVPVPVALP